MPCSHIFKFNAHSESRQIIRELYENTTQQWHSRQSARRLIRRVQMVHTISGYTDISKRGK
jgi:hypothetical protein